jgi:hypothetical protein
MPRLSTKALNKIKKTVNKANKKLNDNDVSIKSKKTKREKVKKVIVREEVESEEIDDNNDDYDNDDNDDDENYKEDYDDEDNNNNNEDNDEEIELNNNNDNNHTLSEYEIQRQENIKRNESFLNSMGLGVLKESIGIENNNKKRVKSDKRVVKNDIIQALPTRRSRRTQRKGETNLIDGVDIDNIEDNGEYGEYNIIKKQRKQIEVILDDEDVLRNPINPHSLREFIDNLSIDHSNNISNAVKLIYLSCLIIDKI